MPDISERPILTDIGKPAPTFAEAMKWADEDEKMFAGATVSVKFLDEPERVNADHELTEEQRKAGLQMDVIKSAFSEAIAAEKYGGLPRVKYSGDGEMYWDRSNIPAEKEDVLGEMLELKMPIPPVCPCGAHMIRSIGGWTCPGYIQDFAYGLDTARHYEKGEHNGDEKSEKAPAEPAARGEGSELH